MLALFIVLGIAVLVVEKPFSEPVKEPIPELGPMFPDFNRDEMVRMQFGSFGGVTVLEKRDGVWVVEDDGKIYPTDMDAVNKVFETIEGLVAKQLIATSPAKHISFQVNAPQETETTDAEGNTQPFRMGTLGTEVILQTDSGEEAVHLFIGKNGAADFMTTYVRRDGSDSVLLVDGYLKAIFGKSGAAGWKDLLICKVEPDEISRIILKSGKDRIEIEAVGQTQVSESKSTDEEPDEHPVSEPESQWRMTHPKVMDIAQTEIERLLEIFKNLRATDFATEQESPDNYQFDTPTAEVTLMFSDGSGLTLTVGAESPDRPNNHYLKKSDSDSVYLIPKYRAEQLKRKPSDFEPKGTDPGVA